MSSYARGLEILAELKAAEINATNDPRNLNPPIVLIPPPALNLTEISRGAYASWSLLLLVPGPANADAWQALDGLLADVAEVLDVETVTPLGYTGYDDQATPLPAYQITVEELI